jgi:hypothetical protein
MEMTWTGWDGTQWTVSDRSQGVVILAGVRGLNMPPTRRFLSRSGALHGTRSRGWTTDEREVFWPVKVFHKGGSTAWLQHERAFFNTMHPGKAGTWKVTQSGGGSSRSLDIKFKDDGGKEFETVPAVTGWQYYDLYLVAEQPFWRGTPVTGIWSVSPPKNFQNTDPVDNSRVFWISSGSTLANANINNPGDVQAWPVYTVVGPSTSATVGGVTVPFEVPAGKALRIDTAPGPLSQTALFGDWVDGAVINTTDRTRELGTIDFAPIQPGTGKALTLSMVGSGEIRAELTPLYFRAW